MSTTKQSVDPVMVRLAATDLFSALSPAALRVVRSSVREHRVTAGSTVVRRGDPDRRLYVIVDGTTRVIRASGASVYLRVGEHFGEIASLDGLSRSASVVAETDLHLVSLAHFNLLALMREHHEVALGVARSLCVVSRREGCPARSTDEIRLPEAVHSFGC